VNKTLLKFTTPIRSPYAQECVEAIAMLVVKDLCIWDITEHLERSPYIKRLFCLHACKCASPKRYMCRIDDKMYCKEGLPVGTSSGIVGWYMGENMSYE